MWTSYIHGYPRYVEVFNAVVAGGHGVWWGHLDLILTTRSSASSRSPSGFGADELGAIRHLDAPLRSEEAQGLRSLDTVGACLARAYIAGAEEESRRSGGRGLAGHEFDRVLGRFPG